MNFLSVFVLSLLFPFMVSANPMVEYNLIPLNGDADALAEVLRAEAILFADLYLEVSVDTLKTPPVVVLEGDREGVVKVLSLSSKYDFKYEAVLSAHSEGVLELLGVYNLAKSDLEELFYESAIRMMTEGVPAITQNELDFLKGEVATLKRRVVLTFEGVNRIEALKAEEPLSDEDLKALKEALEKFDELIVVIETLERFHEDSVHKEVQENNVRLSRVVQKGIKNGVERAEVSNLLSHIRRGHTVSEYSELVVFMKIFDDVIKLGSYNEETRGFKLLILNVLLHKIQSLMEKFDYKNLGEWNRSLSDFIAGGRTYEEARVFFATESGDEFLDLVITSSHTMPSVKFMAESLMPGFFYDEVRFPKSYMEDVMTGVFSNSFSSSLIVSLGFSDRYFEDINLSLHPSWGVPYMLTDEYASPSLLEDHGDSEVLSCKSLL